MKAAISSETSVTTDKSTQCYSSDDTSSFMQNFVNVLQAHDHFVSYIQTFTLSALKQTRSVTRILTAA